MCVKGGGGGWGGVLIVRFLLMGGSRGNMARAGATRRRVIAGVVGISIKSTSHGSCARVLGGTLCACARLGVESTCCSICFPENLCRMAVAKMPIAA